MIGFLSKDFQVVPQMPILPDRDQPTIAIITLLYCEKQAIDVMMENKTTYVRYKTEGKLRRCCHLVNNINDLPAGSELVFLF